jgi:hypothetical protein
MKTVRTLVALAALTVVALAGCCGPHPIRDSWCESWGHPPSSYQPNYYQPQPQYQQQPCCTQPVR